MQHKKHYNTVSWDSTTSHYWQLSNTYGRKDFLNLSVLNLGGLNFCEDLVFTTFVLGGGEYPIHFIIRVLHFCKQSFALGFPPLT